MSGSKLRPIVTDIGCAGFGHNFVRGYSVRDDLWGEDSSWSVTSLMLGGPRLTAGTSRIFDELAVAMASPDPRIWPLKMMWLMGSYGSPVAAVAGSLVYFEGALYGPWVVAEAASLLRELVAVVDRSSDRQDDLCRWLDQRRSAGRLAGFGVAARDEDERLVLVKRTADRHELLAGVHMRTLLQVEAALKDSSSVRPNVAAGVAAILSDLGYSPLQAGMLAVTMVFPQVVGSVAEACALEPELLRRLPLHAVRYEGAAPRRSPRSQTSR